MSKQNYCHYIFLLLVILLPLSPSFSQFLHYDRTQSYSTHETARVLDKEEFAFGFGVNNYFLAWSADSVAYDLLTFDIMLRYGIVKNLEFALKYSYPAAALARMKYGLLKKPVAIAVECGVGSYKMTNQAYRTDRIIDLYPGIIVEKHIYKGISLFAAPKLIYSFYIADRVGQPENMATKTQRCIQYGYAWGIAWGNKKTSFNLENTWYWSKYEKISYKIHQLGFGITRLFD